METQHIACQVCQRLSTTQLEFFCCSCARGLVYRTRISSTHALLDREALDREISSAVTPSDGALASSEDEDEDGPPAAKRTAQLREAEGGRQRSAEAAASCAEACAEIRREIKELRARTSQQRDALAQRRAKVSGERQALNRQAPRAIQTQQEAAQKAEREWAKLHGSISEDRTLLCREVAKIYGLEAKKRRRDAGGRDVYLLGGLPIADLRDLNNTSPRLITASAGRLAHMLHLTSHYLGVQLPAQIDLPSPSSPHTVIHTPTTSYKEPSLPTGRKGGSGTNTTNSSSSSATKPRQRALQLDKPLAALAAEDPVAYSLFVDAISLLAWDLAWLARTQGIDVGARHWEDLCAMGRTAWLLFGPAAAPRPPLSRGATPDAASPAALSPAGIVRRGSSNGTGAEPEDASAPARRVPAAPGHFSHGSARAFLPAAPAAGGAADTMRSWQFASHVRLIERIKAALANDRAGAEWEMLDRDEWAAEEAAAVTAAAAAAAAVAAKDEVASAGADGQAQALAQGPARGWMRLRTKTGSLL